jgi:hypothetical protein
MFEKIGKWILSVTTSQDASSAKRLRQSGAHRVPPDGPRDRRAGRDRRQRADYVDQVEVVDLDPDIAGKLASNDSRKKDRVRNKYQREDTGTHETLTIIDDSIVDSGEETGIDPYNTGNFDRSRNWDKRFQK